MLIPTAVIVATLALAGCSAGATSGSSDSSSGSDSTGSSESRGTAVMPEGAPGVATDSVALAPTANTATSDRQVITTGFVTITVDEPMDAATKAIRIVEQSGGRVDGRAETAPVNGNKGSATLTLRIPSDSLTTTLDTLRTLGAVQEVSLNSADVTMETQDLDARIRAMSASVDRLLALLSTATDTATLVTLETAISDRQAQLESMQSQQRYYADQVSLSTVTLNLVSDFTGPIAEPDNFFSGLVAGWNGFVAFFAGLLVALGVAMPWLVLLGIIATVVVLALKRRRSTP